MGCRPPLHPLALLLLLGPLGCGTFAPAPPVEPPQAHSLLQIVAELQLHLRDDTYRYDRAGTPEGGNVFALALWRLERLRRARGRSWEEWQYVDVVIEHARGRALERLRRYGDARRAYEGVADTGSVLTDAADEGRQVMIRFERHSGPSPEPFETPAAELAIIEKRIDEWRTLAWDFRGTRYEPLAREEAESWEMLRVEWYARHATPKRAIEACNRLVQRHHSSKFYAKHLIRLGDLYSEGARREFLRFRAGMRPFDAERYSGWLDQAFAAYELAGEERKPVQRREAEKKIEALLAYHEGVRSHAP